MKKIYNYENSVITIIVPDENLEVLRNKTEVFLKKVVKEKSYGNISTSRNNRKE